MQAAAPYRQTFGTLYNSTDEIWGRGGVVKENRWILPQRLGETCSLASLSCLTYSSILVRGLWTFIKTWSVMYVDVWTGAGSFGGGIGYRP